MRKLYLEELERHTGFSVIINVNQQMKKHVAVIILQKYFFQRTKIVIFV